MTSYQIQDKHLKMRIPDWIHGGPWEIWVKELDFIENFIKEHDLKRLNRGAVYDDPVPVVEMFDQQVSAAARKTKVRWKYPPIPGGIRIPHLHFRKDVFLVEPEQWRVFSRQVVSNIAEQIMKAENVEFQQLKELSSVANRIA